jgi:hypothetical protein
MGLDSSSVDLVTLSILRRVCRVRDLSSNPAKIRSLRRGRPRAIWLAPAAFRPEFRQRFVQNSKLKMARNGQKKNEGLIALILRESVYMSLSTVPLT